ncbi:MAG: efflux RND transporter periplasmic adaptor subunit [Acidobacteria bacterium]|nr:efflux RND transporter periplasmic adaptor subunit [Acidobacteriota bacterium]
MKRMLRQTLPAAFLVALPLLLISCSSPGNSPDVASATGRGGRGGGRGGGGSVPVVTSRAERKAVPVTVSAVGTVEAISSVQIRPQVTGQLTAIHFAEGREVRQGQALFSLDPRPFQSALLQAQAVLARDTATLRNAEAGQTRTDTLFQRGLVSRDQYESQRASTTALAATIEADKAAVETARLNLQYAEITAPITGRTGSLGAHVGDLVRANDMNSLVVINQLAPVYVTFSVPGRLLADIRRYQAQKPLSVTAASPQALGPAATPAAGAGGTPDAGRAGNGTEAAPGMSATVARGVVTFIDNAVDATTGTIQLKGTFPNSGYQLWPGAFVQVTLTLTTESDAVVVPAAAVQASQEGQYVFVVKPDRTVDMRTVKIGRQQGDEVVIAEGISAGEEVVTDGQLRLTPGARVAEPGEVGGRGASPAGRVR